MEREAEAVRLTALRDRLISGLKEIPHSALNGDREKRMLLKAGEEGPEAYERACGILHREWAAALRKGESLPDLTENCFGEEERKC